MLSQLSQKLVAEGCVTNGVDLIRGMGIPTEWRGGVRRRKQRGGNVVCRAANSAFSMEIRTL